MLTGLTLIAIVSYLAPLMAVVRQQDQWRLDLEQSFGSTTNPRSLWSLKTTLFGRGELAIPFVRGNYNIDAPNEIPINIDRYLPLKSVDSSPWILVIHGGGWDSGNSEQLPDLNSHLANLGYTVFSIDYRLAPKVRWPEIKSDVLKAIAYIKSHSQAWNIDANRWVILGRSAGGQIAGAVAYSLKGVDRPQGFVSLYAPTDLTFGYEVGYEDDILASRGLIRALMGSPPLQNSDLYKTASMIEQVSINSCPTLLIHGKLDTLVWFKHAERLSSRLKVIGVKAAALVVPWGPHGFDFFLNGPEGQISTAAIEHFLDRMLPVKQLR